MKYHTKQIVKLNAQIIFVPIGNKPKIANNFFFACFVTQYLIIPYPTEVKSIGGRMQLQL